MKYYTQTIPFPLAEKLKEKGMHHLRDSRMEGWLNSGDNITYAEVFDWFLDSRIDISAVEMLTGMFKGYVGKNTMQVFESEFFGTWHEVANAAIEKALTLI